MNHKDKEEKGIKKMIWKLQNWLKPTNLEVWDNLMAEQTDIVISIPDYKKAIMTEREITSLKFHLDEIKSLLDINQ